MSKSRATWSNEEGAVVVLVLLFIPVLFALTALAVDVSRWYVEIAKVQKAADAAALAGVTWMPQDLTNAKLTAQKVAAKNGYSIALGDAVGVETDPALRPSQLKVTVASPVFDNFFGYLIGSPTMRVTRLAVADFNAPAPMGSPCNTFGNEPLSNASAAPPTGSVLPTGQAIDNCSSTPEFWPAMEGPATDKVEGDRYATVGCPRTGGSTYNGSLGSCTGGNKEYREEGYFMIVKVQPSAVGTPIELQLYDPNYVPTGNKCTTMPTPTNGMNTYAPDATLRYGSANASASPSRFYCPGDFDPGESGLTPPRMDTTFILREQTDTFRPLEGAAITACTKQYRGYDRDNNGNADSPSTAALTSSSASYNSELARVFHQWVSHCTFTPTRSGDYYLQVRTNVPAFPSTSGVANNGTNTPLVYAQDSIPSGTTTTGRGLNGFAVRANPLTAAKTSVSVAGWERMPIYVNSSVPSGSSLPTEFNLLRVLPGAAGRTLEFSIFDAADVVSSGSGTIQVLRPVDATGGQIGVTGRLCTGKLTSTTGGTTSTATSSLSNCSVTIASSTHNGELQTISVPIPSDYNCNYTDPRGCWFRLQESFGSGVGITDFTTWDAVLKGDPVRITQ